MPSVNLKVPTDAPTAESKRHLIDADARIPGGQARGNVLVLIDGAPEGGWGFGSRLRAAGRSAGTDHDGDNQIDTPTGIKTGPSPCA